MSIVSKIAFSALTAGTITAIASPARADLMTVKGKATVDLADARLLSFLGQSATVGSVIEFEYTYDSTPPPTQGRPDGENSAGTFKITGLGAAFAMNMSGVYPDNMITWGFDGADFDNYGSLANKTTDAGVDYRAFAGFSDHDGTAFPANSLTFQFPEHPKALLESQAWDERVIGISVLDPEGTQEALTTAVSATITELIVIAVAEPTGGGDSDGDGVADAADDCSGTTSGAATNADGCSVADLVPCAAPLGGGTWRNHGKYVSNVAKIAQEFFEAGLITEAEKDALIEAAGNSTCGRP